ncbi:KGG domain-containing protein, partial [Nitrosomonas sp.]
MVTTKQKQDSDENEGRGFAGMDPEKQREIASKGGKAAHQSGNAHEFNSQEAREAGIAAHQSGNAHEFDSQEAREAGRQSHKNDDDDNRRTSRSRSSRDD